MFLLLTICYMTPMPQDFKIFVKTFWIFSYYWSLLKSYQIIPIRISPNGVEKMFNGSWLKFSEQTLWITGLQNFPLNFWFLPVFVVVSIVIRLFVTSCWLPKHAKYLFFSNWGIFERIDRLPLNVFDFNICWDFRNEFSINIFNIIRS